MRSFDYDNVWYNPTKKEIMEAGLFNLIGFDFDSTINEMGHPLGHYIADKLYVPFEEIRGLHPDGYERFHFSHPTVDDEQITAIVNEYVINHTKDLKPTPYMGDVMNYVWLKTREPILVITYRPKESVEQTHAWLKKYLPVGCPFNLIMLQGMQKDVVLKRMNVQVYVDDRYKTAVILEQAINLSVLYKRPWNQGRPVSAGDMEINDLRDLIPIVNYLTRSCITDWPTGIPYPGFIDA
jgi:hypothetical protein